MLMIPPMPNEMNIHHHNLQRQAQQEDASTTAPNERRAPTSPASERCIHEEKPINDIAFCSPEIIIRTEGENEDSHRTCTSSSLSSSGTETKPVPPCSSPDSEVLVAVVSDTVTKMCTTSSSPPTSTSAIKRRSSLHVPNVTWSGMATHGLLGSGAFCNVYKVGIKDSILGLTSSTHQKSSSSTSHNSWEDEGNHSSSYYALKCLSDRAMKDDRDYMVAAMDLAFEAKILSQLNHPNIITLHATNHADHPSKTRAGAKLILILGLLESTLHHKLTEWRTAASVSKPFASFRSSKNHEENGDGPKYKVSTEEVIQRLESTAMGIVQGMEYLHQEDIVLRDLKPDNVGYTSDGTVQLFDFGLAQYVVRRSSSSSDKENNTGPQDMAGSFRYMAPENGLKKGCTLSSDVYSFGILLWEICTLKKPYAEIKTVKNFQERVFKGHCRPSLRGHFEAPQQGAGRQALGTFLMECWDSDPMKRPTFASIRTERLPAIIASLRNDEQEATKRKPPKRRHTGTLSSKLHSLSSSLNNGLRMSRHPPARSTSSRNTIKRSPSSSESSFSCPSTSSETEFGEDSIGVKGYIDQIHNNDEDEETGTQPTRSCPGRSDSTSRMAHRLLSGLPQLPSFKRSKKPSVSPEADQATSAPTTTTASSSSSGAIQLRPRRHPPARSKSYDGDNLLGLLTLHDENDHHHHDHLDEHDDVEEEGEEFHRGRSPTVITPPGDQANHHRRVISPAPSCEREDRHVEDDSPRRHPPARSKSCDGDNLLELLILQDGNDHHHHDHLDEHDDVEEEELDISRNRRSFTPLVRSTSLDAICLYD